MGFFCFEVGVGLWGGVGGFKFFIYVGVGWVRVGGFLIIMEKERLVFGSDCLIYFILVLLGKERFVFR